VKTPIVKAFAGHIYNPATLPCGRYRRVRASYRNPGTLFFLSKGSRTSDRRFTPTTNLFFLSFSR
jgi:hypothetical protein